MNEKLGVLVCGVQKGGTTSLYEYFCEHPELAAPARKEIHFFDDETIDWASPDYATLHGFFGEGDAGRMRFDVTPIYSFWPPSMQRIKAYNAAAKLIFLFRDPFERAWSQWCMEFARGDEHLSFSEAIRSGRRRMDGRPALGAERRTYSYVERGLYAEQVARARVLPARATALLALGRSSRRSRGNARPHRNVPRHRSVSGDGGAARQRATATGREPAAARCGSSVRRHARER